MKRPGLSRSFRPSRLARPMRRLAKTAVLVVGLAVGLFVAGAAFSVVYAQYGYHPETNARSWAALTPTFAGRAACAGCHTAEAERLAGARHAAISCESCHGALGTHAAAGEPAAVKVVSPSAEACAICHLKVAGRPASFPQEDPATHYSAGSCLVCHDAHTATAARPPRVTHPLVNLPACTVCHTTRGLRPMPAGHVESTDKVCLGCHAPERR